MQQSDGYFPANFLIRSLLPWVFFWLGPENKAFWEETVNTTGRRILGGKRNFFRTSHSESFLIWKKDYFGRNRWGFSRLLSLFFCPEIIAINGRYVTKHMWFKGHLPLTPPLASPASDVEGSEVKRGWSRGGPITAQLQLHSATTRITDQRQRRVVREGENDTSQPPSFSIVLAG